MDRRRTKVSLVKTVDVDVLRDIIVKLQQRVKEGSNVAPFITNIYLKQNIKGQN